MFHRALDGRGPQKEEGHERARRTSPRSLLRRDPITGKERERWHPAGTDRAEAEGTMRRSASSTPVRRSADHEPRDFAVGDPDATSGELGGLGVGQFLGVGEIDDVVGPLANQLGVDDRA